MIANAVARYLGEEGLGALDPSGKYSDTERPWRHPARVAAEELLDYASDPPLSHFYPSFEDTETLQGGVRGGCVLGTPWDFGQMSEDLMATPIGRNIYARAMGSNLAKLGRNHLVPLLLSPFYLLFFFCCKLYFF